MNLKSEGPKKKILVGSKFCQFFQNVIGKIMLLTWMFRTNITQIENEDGQDILELISAK